MCVNTMLSSGSTELNVIRAERSLLFEYGVTQSHSSGWNQTNVQTLTYPQIKNAEFEKVHMVSLYVT